MPRVRTCVHVHAAAVWRVRDLRTLRLRGAAYTIPCRDAIPQRPARALSETHATPERPGAAATAAAAGESAAPRDAATNGDAAAAGCATTTNGDAAVRLAAAATARRAIGAERGCNRHAVAPFSFRMDPASGSCHRRTGFFSRQAAGWVWHGRRGRSCGCGAWE